MCALLLWPAGQKGGSVDELRISAGVLIILCLMAGPMYALTVRPGDYVQIGVDELIDDDLIALGKTIVINGKVEGDLLAFGQDITINGEVGGTIFCGGSRIDIKGIAHRSVWMAGGTVTNTGQIGRNALFFGGMLGTGNESSVKKDLILYGGNINLAGSVEGDIKGGVGSLVISGKARNVDLKADQANIKSTAEIMGDLTIRGKNMPVVEDGAKIMGKRTFQKIEKVKASKRHAGPRIAFVFKTIIFLSQILVGILMISLTRGYCRRVMDALVTTPWLSLLWGFVTLIALPIVTIILCLTVIGWSLAILAGFTYLAFLYVCAIPFSLAIGEQVIKFLKKEGKISLYLSLVVGLLIIFLLGLIPYLGFLVNITVLFLGTGMTALGSYRLFIEARSQTLI